MPRAVWFFLLPNLLGFLAFTLIPVAASLYMAFTNWSLKPSIERQWVGLRNFTDLLGVRAIASDAPALMTTYLAATAILTLTAGAFVWGALADWAGRRLGGILAALLGATTMVAGLSHGGDHGLVIVGVVCLAIGAKAAWSEGTWQFGSATAMAILAALAAGVLYATHATMWQHYEPTDTRFWQYLGNTVYLMLAIPVSIAMSLALAMLLHEQLPRGRWARQILAAGTMLLCGALSVTALWVIHYPNLAVVAGLFWLVASLGLGLGVVSYRTVYYLPSFTAGVAIMVLWKALFNPDTGPINLCLAWLSGRDVSEMPQWLASVVWAKPALMIMGVWVSAGGMNMLLYLAALSNVPREQLEAASIDGAGAWARFRHVILPHLAPTTFFIIVMSTIGGLQGGFEQARVMTQGGPAGATTTLSYYIYNLAFVDLDLGYAAAVSWVLFTIIAILTAMNWKFGRTAEV